MTTMGKISESVRQAALVQIDDSIAVMVIERDSFNNPDLIERILVAIPAPDSTHFDVRIVVTECVANLVQHSDCTTLIVATRQEDELLFVQFTHIPPLPPTMRHIIKSASCNILPNFDDPAYCGAGLGYPMMARICAAITLSHDNASLEFSFAIPQTHHA